MAFHTLRTFALFLFFGSTLAITSITPTWGDEFSETLEILSTEANSQKLYFQGLLEEYRLLMEESQVTRGANGGPFFLIDPATTATGENSQLAYLWEVIQRSLDTLRSQYDEASKELGENVPEKLYREVSFQKALRTILEQVDFESTVAFEGIRSSFQATVTSTALSSNRKKGSNFDVIRVDGNVTPEKKDLFRFLDTVIQISRSAPDRRIVRHVNMNQLESLLRRADIRSNGYRVFFESYKSTRGVYETLAPYYLQGPIPQAMATFENLRDQRYWANQFVQAAVNCAVSRIKHGGVDIAKALGEGTILEEEVARPTVEAMVLSFEAKLKEEVREDRIRLKKRAKRIAKRERQKERKEKEQKEGELAKEAQETFANTPSETPEAHANDDAAATTAASDTEPTETLPTTPPPPSHLDLSGTTEPTLTAMMGRKSEDEEQSDLDHSDDETDSESQNDLQIEKTALDLKVWKKTKKVTRKKKTTLCSSPRAASASRHQIFLTGAASRVYKTAMGMGRYQIKNRDIKTFLSQAGGGFVKCAGPSSDLKLALPNFECPEDEAPVVDKMHLMHSGREIFPQSRLRVHLRRLIERSGLSDLEIVLDETP